MNTASEGFSEESLRLSDEFLDEHDPQTVAVRLDRAIGDLATMSRRLHSIGTLYSRQLFDHGALGEMAGALIYKSVRHAVSFLRLIPAQGLSVKDIGPEFWDVSSQACLARALMECLDMLVYIRTAPAAMLSDQLILNGLRLHDLDRRSQVLKMLGSTASRAQTIYRDREKYFQLVVGDPCFSKLSQKIQKNIERSQPPDFLIELPQRLVTLDIEKDAWATAKIVLSSHVHSHPFSLLKIANHDIGDIELVREISIVCRMALASICVLVEFMEQELGSLTPPDHKCTAVMVENRFTRVA